MQKKAKINDMEVYLRPTFAIDSDHERIVETAEKLTVGCSSDEEKAVKLFYFVRRPLHK